MGLVQQRQIADKITSAFIPYIAADDLSGKPAADRDVNLLSRGLAAYALAYLASVDEQTASGSITDGYNDNGVDAIYYESADKVLYLVQAKWNTKHSGSIDLGDCLKFLKGAKDVLNSRFDKFGRKIKDRKKEIDAAISVASRVVVVVCYSGSGSFSVECDDAMKSFIEEVDDTRELVSYSVLNQPALYQMLLQGTVGGSIKENITLYEWGGLEEPVKAIYGQIAASDLVALHKKHGHRLFSRNIRMFLGDSTQVNAGIQSTISDSPDLFWYLNNGITALASEIKRTVAGGTTRAAGTFDCSGLSVVNGAQTIGSLSSCSDTLADACALARVPIRIISLNGAPDGFSSLITKTNNTQNRIDARNFVALDPHQERLRAEFAIDKIDYEYRQGEIELSGARKLDLTEATIALACSQADVDLAIQAKREIGKLWDDISRPPYKALFNSGSTSEDIWNRVMAFRRINEQLEKIEFATGGKDSNLVTHGNRFLGHIIYRHLFAQDPGNKNIPDSLIQKAAVDSVELLASTISERFPDNYVASLFKNLSKCRELANEVNAKLAEKAAIDSKPLQEVPLTRKRTRMSEPKP